MAESAISPGTDPGEGAATPAPGIEHSEPDTEQPQEQEAPALPSTSAIIWTPRFIVLFGLTLVIGLSAEGLLVQGWSSHLYSGGWVLLGLVSVVSSYLLVMLVRAHSVWVRGGALFACAWALFAGFNAVAQAISADPDSPIFAHLSAATWCALLGAYICFSLSRTPLLRWDAWFFRLALVAGSGAVALAYFLTPSDSRSLETLEGTLTTTALILCITVWWARPSCWKAQPGPTFLLGMAPTILLLLTIPGIANGSENFFMTQVAFLCILLGTIRVLQGEIVH